MEGTLLRREKEKARGDAPSSGRLREEEKEKEEAERSATEAGTTGWEAQAEIGKEGELNTKR